MTQVHTQRGDIHSGDYLKGEELFENVRTLTNKHRALTLNKYLGIYCLPLILGDKTISFPNPKANTLHNSNMKENVGINLQVERPSAQESIKLGSGTISPSAE